MTDKLTDWVVVCRSGATIDGRNIDKKMLEQAEEVYNPLASPVFLWGYHVSDPVYRANATNLGKVAALKTEQRADGFTYLLARLLPNQFALYYNQLKQKLYTSCEFIKNYAGTDKWFLSGIALTDIPASLYTQELHFTNNGMGMTNNMTARGSVEAFSFAENTEAINKMNEQQFSTLMYAVNEKNQHIAQLEQKINQLAQQNNPQYNQQVNPQYNAAPAQPAQFAAAAPAAAPAQNYFSQPQPLPAAPVQQPAAQFTAPVTPDLQPAAAAQFTAPVQQPAPAQPAPAQPAPAQAEAHAMSDEQFSQLMNAVNGLQQNFNNLLQDTTRSPAAAPGAASFTIV